MKETIMAHKTIFLIGVGILLFLVPTLLFMWLHSSGEDTVAVKEAPIEKKEKAKAPEALISGAWYSDAVDKEVITLKEDGTFQSDRRSPGTFSVDDTEVSLQGKEGNAVSLLLQTKDQEMVLYDSEKKTYFYHSQALLKQSKQEQEQAAGDETILLDQRMKDILQKGTWKSEDKKTTLVFHGSEYTVTYTDGKEVKKEVWAYKIKEVILQDKLQNNGVLLEVIQQHQKLTPPTQEIKFTISESEDTYSLFAEVSFARQYYKAKKDVPLTQNGTTNEEVKQSQTSTTVTTDKNGNEVRSKEKIIKKTEGWGDE